MKTFNFETSRHNPKKTMWLKNNHRKNISENDFILSMKDLQKFSKGKSKYYKPSRLKKEYRKFKELYGFFNK